MLVQEFTSEVPNDLIAFVTVGVKIAEFIFEKAYLSPVLAIVGSVCNNDWGVGRQFIQ